MEIIKTERIDVFTRVTNLPINFESTNKVTIYLLELFQDEAGIVTTLAGDHIRLKPCGGFTPHHLSRLFHNRQVHESQYLGETIARKINNSLDNDHSLREPVFVTVAVNFIRQRRLILPPPVLPTPSRFVGFDLVFGQLQISSDESGVN